MRVGLFGLSTESYSRTISAQKRINCFVEMRKEHEKTALALIGRPGLDPFVTGLSNPVRGMWAVNSLATPLVFFVEADQLYAADQSGVLYTIGNISTSSGNVSMADDGKWLVLVDGTYGYYYNMLTPAGITTITDGNFTTTPTTVTWQDTYFIVTSSSQTKQFQLSSNSDPSTWPAVNINFAGSGQGKLRAGISDHSILNLFGDTYTEFWQDTGSPDFPFALIPGAAQQFGLAAAWSLAKFDNSLVGLFQDNSGNVNVSRMSGFSLKKLSDSDMDMTFQGYNVVSDACGFAFTMSGHAFYVINFPTMQESWMYDANGGTWTQIQDTTGNHFWGLKYATLQNKLLVSDHRNGNIYQFSMTTYTDNGSPLPMEIQTRHIWDDDRYIGINWIQIDVQSGTGTAVGQGANPVMDLQVSKDGGNTFYSVGFSKIGPVGEYTQRVIWNSLGAARDWVLKLRVTDPVKRVITGASAEIIKGSY